MRRPALSVAISLGAAALSLADEVEGPFAEALAQESKGRVSEAIRLLENLDETWSDQMALGFLGSMLEVDGREDRAMEVYLRLLELPFGGREAISCTDLMDKAWPLSVKSWTSVPRGIEDARKTARGRLVAISANLGGAAWEKAVAAVPAAGEASVRDWRDAIAANHLIPAERSSWANGGSEIVQQWMEFLRRKPENRVAVKWIIEQNIGIDWDAFRTWVSRNCPPLPLGLDIELQLKGLAARNAGDLQRWNDLADWMESKSIEDLRSVPRETVEDSAWKIVEDRAFEARGEAPGGFDLPFQRIMDRLIESTDDTLLEAELRMALSLGIWVFSGPESPRFVEEANAATGKLEELDARGITLLDPFPRGRRVLPNLESVPHRTTWMWEILNRQGSPRGGGWIERLDSPVLRTMVAGDRHSTARLQRLVRELDEARQPGRPAARRDLRRLLWSESSIFRNDTHDPLLQSYREMAGDDLEAAASDESEPHLAVEAIARLAVPEARDPFGEPDGIPQTDAYRRFVDAARKRIDESPLARDVVLSAVLNLGFATREEWRPFFEGHEQIRKRSVAFSPSLEDRFAEGANEGLFDLTAALRHADKEWALWHNEHGWRLTAKPKREEDDDPFREREGEVRAVSPEEQESYVAALLKGFPPPDEEKGLRILRELHGRYPNREAWAVELALRTPNEEEACLLLDQVMALGEIVFHRALWSAPSALAMNGFGRPDLGDGGRPAPEIGKRLARWEALRRPEGSRRWMRESGALFGRSEAWDAFEMMLDGAGSAESAYRSMRGLEFKLGYSQEMLFSIFDTEERRLASEKLEEMRMTEEGKLAMARRVLLSGAYAWDEHPWFNRIAYTTPRIPPPPYGRSLTTALSDLIIACESRNHDQVFPAGFLRDLKEVDPVTWAWIKAVFECVSALDLPLIDEADWFEDERWPMGSAPLVPFAVAASELRRPVRLLKSDRMWHDLARYQASLLRARSLADAERVPQLAEFLEAFDRHPAYPVPLAN